MQIEVYLPRGALGLLNVADTDLVYDGTTFVHPQSAEYVALYSAPVFASTLPYKGLVEELQTSETLKARVKARFASTTSTDADVIHVLNPSPECVCGITCSGTFLQYVQVKVQT